MKIQILTYDGADELDFVGPLEVFRRAAKLRTDIDVALSTLEPQTKVTAAHGLCVHPDGVLEDRVDLLVVPGGGFVNRAPAGVRAEIERGELPRRIAALKKGGAIVAGVCTGTMAVSATGLLDGRPATTHHAALDNLRATTAHVIAARVVDDGDILTCGGVTSSLDLALWVVERFWGAETAAVVARDLEYTWTRDVHVSEKEARSKTK